MPKPFFPAQVGYFGKEYELFNPYWQLTIFGIDHLRVKVLGHAFGGTSGSQDIVENGNLYSRIPAKRRPCILKVRNTEIDAVVAIFFHYGYLHQVVLGSGKFPVLAKSDEIFNPPVFDKQQGSGKKETAGLRGCHVSAVYVPADLPDQGAERFRIAEQRKYVYEIDPLLRKIGVELSLLFNDIYSSPPNTTNLNY